ncbi:hypothetical protein JTB14_027180 [Gonioctena quinquepunctata]|nr:hypothetical protein JTB14_027180 [Gonioctena quinquepunctata]
MVRRSPTRDSPQNSQKECCNYNSRLQRRRKRGRTNGCGTNTNHCNCNKDAEGVAPETNNTQMPTQLEEEKLKKLEGILHMDRDIIEGITSTLIKEKQIQEKKEAERNEFLRKKRRQKIEEQNKLKNAEETPNKKLLEMGKLQLNRHASSGEKAHRPPRAGRISVENRLEELQKKIHDRALELTEKTMKEYITFNPNIKGYNVDQIKKLIREDMYNQNVDRLSEISKDELTRLKSMMEANAEFLKSPKKIKKARKSTDIAFKR